MFIPTTLVELVVILALVMVRIPWMKEDRWVHPDLKKALEVD